MTLISKLKSSYKVRRFMKHKPAVVGVVIVVLFLLAGAFGPTLAPYDPYRQGLPRLTPPSWQFPMGTDGFGRDIFSRVLHGARLSLTVGLGATALGVCIGGTLGMLAGYFPKTLERPIMFITEVLLAFPSILLAMAVVAILGTGLTNVIIAVGVRQVPSYVRMTRSTVLSVRDAEYTEAARALGASTPRILGKTILPNIMAPLMVYTTLQVGWTILLAALLSFVGLGVQAPTPEWGYMVAEGRAWLRQAPHVATMPGLVILALVMSLNLIGDALRDALDPRLKQ